MVTFGIELEDCKTFPEATKFLIKSNERLQVEDMTKNPFNGSINSFGNMAIIIMEPIIFKFYLLSIIWFALGIILGWVWSIVVGFVFLSTCFFWSPQFFFFILKKGIKKAGYKGKVKLINKDEVIGRLIQWDN